MKTLNQLVKGIALGLFFLLLSLAPPAFAQVNVNPRLDNPLNPLPLARVTNATIDSVTTAPDFKQMNRRPALVLFYNGVGDLNTVNASSAALNMLALVSLEYLYQVDIYTVDNSRHPEIFAAYNKEGAVKLTAPVWLRVVPPSDTHPIDLAVWNESKGVLLTQTRLENWLNQTPYVKVAGTQFTAPLLPYNLDQAAKTAKLDVPHLGDPQAVDSAGLLRIAVLFYPEVTDANRGVYRAITLAGIESFRFLGRTEVFVAPRGLLDDYLHLNVKKVAPDEPQLVVLSVNSAGKVVAGASYDPDTTFASDATKAGLPTSQLSQPDVEAFISAAVEKPNLNQAAFLDLGKVRALMNSVTNPPGGSRAALEPNGPRHAAAVIQTGETQEASVLRQ